MTLNNRYKQIMDKIEVTPEMQERILSSLDKKPIRFLKYRKYLYTAACFLVLIVGAIALPKLLNPAKPQDPIQVVNGIAKYESTDELSKAVGFEVAGLTSLPFEVTEQVYLVYWQSLAEIKYSGNGQTASFRKSAGSEDNSGDFNTYGTVAENTLNSVTVTLKGNEGTYSLALWEDGGYSYSIRLTKAVTEEELLTMVSNAG